MPSDLVRAGCVCMCEVIYPPPSPSLSLSLSLPGSGRHALAGVRLPIKYTNYFIYLGLATGCTRAGRGQGVPRREQRRSSAQLPRKRTRPELKCNTMKMPAQQSVATRLHVHWPGPFARACTTKFCKRCSGRGHDADMQAHIHGGGDELSMFRQVG